MRTPPPAAARRRAPARPPAGEIRLGDTEARVRRLWGTPLSVTKAGARATKTFGFWGGRLVVYIERGRVRMVAVRGTLRTTKRDRAGTPLPTFRKRWAGTVHRSCCAVGVRHVRVPTRSRGVVFVATFRDGRLHEIALADQAVFEACFLAECD